jgi:GNAT superfamily N-acetyltransferase
MALRIVPVDGRRGMRRFVDVPWKVYDARKHPQWVPPLRSQVRDLLDDRKNPFYFKAARALFVAEDRGRLLGRIAAIENRAHNEFHEDRVGFYGFFESVDDQAVASGLLAAASDWLEARGLTAMRGPVNPSTNYDCGTLIGGYDYAPTFLTTWNPPYYPTLMERAGMHGVKDLVSYFVSVEGENGPDPERMKKMADRLRQRGGVTFRSLDLGRYWEEVEKVWGVYRVAWERNWGFVPVTREEFQHMAKDLEHLIVEEFVLIAEADGQVVGFLLLVMDYNPILKKIGNGRLFPTGILRLLLGKGKIKIARVMALGIKPEYRQRGIIALFLDELLRRGRDYEGIGADASWILEDNLLMRQPIEQIGGTLTRRWRIYEKAIGTK